MMSRFRDGDLTLAYETYGSGDHVLVYLHGLLLDSHVNRVLARRLAAEGFRVVLLDLPGHGGSDKPRQTSAHRMDDYARRVVHLLDELGVERAVVGGMSLGADVTLQMAVQAPERLQGMVLEMPVLEGATPIAAMVFVPLLAATHVATPVMRVVNRLARQVPRQLVGWAGVLMAPLLSDPEEVVAVLHGVLVGPVAPTAEERAAMHMPALVIGHGSDLLHPLDDAARLAEQLPNAQLVQARSITELRLRPDRLTDEIAAFLRRVWEAPAVGRTRSA